MIIRGKSKPYAIQKTMAGRALFVYMLALFLPIRPNEPNKTEDPMNWRQFLTPVKSIDTNQAKSYLADKKVDEVTILDVRQPKEYEAGHIPGAVLAPLAGAHRQP
jgi:hypothetical protein